MMIREKKQLKQKMQIWAMGTPHKSNVDDKKIAAAPSLCSIVEVVKGSSDAPIPDYVESIYW